jgi:hypothetical protein
MRIKGRLSMPAAFEVPRASAKIDDAGRARRDSALLTAGCEFGG